MSKNASFKTRRARLAATGVGALRARNAAQITVTFDARYGYPASAFIDCDRRNADEAVSYSVIGFRFR